MLGLHRRFNNIFQVGKGKHSAFLNVLQRFDKANLQLHPGIGVFAQHQVQYLGFVLSYKVGFALPDNVKAARLSPTPEKHQRRKGTFGPILVLHKTSA